MGAHGKGGCGPAEIAVEQQVADLVLRGLLQGQAVQGFHQLCLIKDTMLPHHAVAVGVEEGLENGCHRDSSFDFHFSCDMVVSNYCCIYIITL